ncbi:hypothetical protein C2S51_029774 [Perilla frutescens var. frutescens]|nr:hypothetical protein C2S51_029774 [Perilla frutescens var. frutescens]
MMLQVPTLQDLDLSSNNFHNETIPQFRLSALRSIDMSFCGFVGPIPCTLAKQAKLVHLDLSLNFLTGVIPSFSMSKKLTYIDLSINSLMGSLSDRHFEDYSNNYFHSSTPSNIVKNITNSSINFLSLANNSLSGAILASICNIFGLLVLHLSFNNFSGIIPPCIVEKSTENLQVLNLRGNNINGDIPDQFIINCSLRTLDLSHNNLGGKIPKSLANCPGLEVVNVGYNNFDDNFPCMLSPRLHVLVLRSNKFHGEWRCDKSWPNLQIVDISSNNFSGSLHLLNFSTWRGMMLQRDAHLRPNRSVSNLLGGDIFYYKDEVTLTVKGIVVNLVKIWPDFTSIDLSCNNFHGGIPDEVSNLSLLYLLNLSHNALTASIPKSLGALTELGSLDLSFNQLRGRIPEELARLTFLSILNLSYNELVGMIPIGPQFQTF